MKNKRTYRVATFWDPKQPLMLGKVRCFTRWHNPRWPGCVWFDVFAECGAKAKRLAARGRVDLEMANRFHAEMNRLSST